MPCVDWIWFIARTRSRSRAARSKSERLGRLVHVLDKLVLHGAAFAVEEQFRFANQLAIARLVDAPDAGRAAALDLEQQARPRARLEHRIRARAQQERALQRVERAAHRLRARERPEIDAFGRARAAMLEQLRKGMILAQQDIREGFVVAIGDVVAGLQTLDEIGFEQQRLGLRRRRDEQHLRRVGDHARDALVVPAGLGVGRDTFLEALGLADVEDVALGIHHAIDARRVGKRLQIGGNPRHALERRRLLCSGIVHGADIIARRAVAKATDKRFLC